MKPNNKLCPDFLFEKDDFIEILEKESNLETASVEKGESTREYSYRR